MPNRASGLAGMQMPAENQMVHCSLLFARDKSELITWR
jgi:hypothetical protein